MLTEPGRGDTYVPAHPDGRALAPFDRDVHRSRVHTEECCSLRDGQCLPLTCQS